MPALDAPLTMTQSHSGLPRGSAWGNDCLWPSAPDAPNKVDGAPAPADTPMYAGSPQAPVSASATDCTANIGGRRAGDASPMPTSWAFVTHPEPKGEPCQRGQGARHEDMTVEDFNVLRELLFGGEDAAAKNQGGGDTDNGHSEPCVIGSVGGGCGGESVARPFFDAGEGFAATCGGNATGLEPAMHMNAACTTWQCM